MKLRLKIILYTGLSLILCAALSGAFFAGRVYEEYVFFNEDDGSMELIQSKDLLDSLINLRAGNYEASIKYHENEIWEMILPMHRNKEDLADFCSMLYNQSIDGLLTAMALQFQDHPIMGVPFEGIGEEMADSAARTQISTQQVDDAWGQNMIYSSRRSDMKRARLTQDTVFYYLECAQ